MVKSTLHFLELSCVICKSKHSPWQSDVNILI